MKNLKMIIGLVKPFKFLVVQLIISIVILALYKQISPLMSREIIDSLGAYSSGTLTKSVFWDKMTGVLVIIFFANILNWIAGRISWRQSMILQEKLKSHMRIIVIKHLLRQDIAFFDKQVSGNIMSQVDRGINKLVDEIGESTSFFLPNILAAILAVIVIASIDYKFVLLMLFIFIPFIGINLWAIKQHEPLQKQFNKTYDQKYGHFWEVISSIRLVRSFNREEFETKKMSKFNSQILNLNFKIEKVWDKASLKDILLDTWIFVLSIYLIANVVSNNITIGTFVLLTQYTITLREPLWNLNWMYFEYKKSIIGARDLLKILNREPKIKNSINPLKPLIEGNVSFKNVNFEYKKDKPIFKDLSFDILKGQTVALVGKSGAGKTTILNLLNRFYDINGGTILIDGNDIQNIDIDHLHSTIGVVLQEAYLFADTIEENLKYGNPKATEEELIQACKISNAWEFISELDKGLKTQIGERGIKLSGGQKQRLSIARTVLKNPPILIFDEATSSLDTESERKVQDALFNIVKDRTTIIIAHRLSTIERADKIIVIGDGSVQEEGNHFELIKKEGIYAMLHKMQSSRTKSKILDDYEII